MKRRFSIGIFYNYLLSYVGIAAFFCALIGVYLFNTFVSGYTASLLENEQKKAITAIQDLDTQVNVMSKIAYSVANSMGYSYAELQESNYTEFKMLQEFMRYASASTLSQQYFLYYHNQDRIYATSVSAVGKGSVYEQEFFAKLILAIDDYKSFYRQLRSLKRMSIVPLPEDGRLLFCFPVQIKGSVNNAVLCFIAAPQQLLDRIQLSSGGLSNFRLSCRDGALLLDETTLGATGQLIQAASPNGMFQLTMGVDPSAYMSRLLSYRRITLFCLAVCAGILVVAVVVANFHAKPIRKIKQQLNLDADGRSNDLLDISQKLTDIMTQDNAQKSLFNNQLYMLRSQTIHLLLCGEYNDALRDMAVRLNIHVENGHSGVIVLRFPKPLDDAQMDDLMARIEDLSMEQMSFYCAKDPHTRDIDIILYLPTVQEITQKDAMDLLQELLAAEEVEVRIGDGWVYPDPHKLAASFAEACDDLLKGNAGGFDLTITNDQKYFEKIVGAVRLGETEEAQRVFQQFTQENQAALNSMMMQRYLLGELLNLLVRAAQDMHINIPPQQISVVLTVQNPKAACDGLRDIMDYMGAHVRLAESTDDKLINRLVEYVKQHYTENDLSLDRLAAHFNVSAGYLSRLFRVALGIKYKDYVLRLRMDHARACLDQGQSVASTSQACGYANISHFIKTFKLYTGVTPSAYQKGDKPAFPPALSMEDSSGEDEEDN